MPNTLAILNKSAPLGSSNGQESLDMALAMSNFGQDVCLFFLEDGVFQLLAAQDATKINQKPYYKTFKALEFYDIEHIYVCRQSLTERRIDISDLVVSVILIEPAELSAKLADLRHIMVF